MASEIPKELKGDKVRTTTPLPRNNMNRSSIIKHGGNVHADINNRGHNTHDINTHTSYTSKVGRCTDVVIR